MSRSVVSLVVAASVSALTLTLAGPGAHAADQPAAADAGLAEPTRAPAPDGTPTMAAGVLVKTTTKAASQALITAVEDVLPTGVEVAGARASVTGERTTVLPTDERVTGAEAEVVAAELRERPDVVWAMPNYILTAQAQAPVTTNDTAFTQDRVRAVWDARSSNHGRVKAVLGSSAFPAGGYSSKAPYLWRKTRGAGQVVAVIDTGITNHPDLPSWNDGSPSGRMLPGYDFVSRYRFPDGTYEDTGRDRNGWDADATDEGDWIDRSNYCGAGVPAEGSSWHGTHVAGTIAAASNTQGIVGVAPEVSILPVRALGLCGGTSEDIIAAIRWAAGLPVGTSPDGVDTPLNPHPADVINLSLGTYVVEGSSTFRPCNRTYAAPFVEAIAEARRADPSAGRKGSVIVAAAGNDGWSTSSRPSLPATCPGVVAVGATSEYGDRAGYAEEEGRKAVYSNYGSAIDVSAPGGDYFWDGRGILSTLNSGATRPKSATYGEYIGTSMASPVVAASAAMIRSLGTFSASQTETALETAVTRFPRPGRSAQFRPCSTSICGSGIVSLNRVPAPLGKPAIRGDLAVGEPLTASPGWWNATPSSFSYTWLRDGTAISGATRSTYTPTTADAGARLTVRVAPSSAAFAPVRSLSDPTAAVPDGPAVSLAGLPDSTTYGVAGSTATVTVDGVGSGGQVELRRGATVLASGTTDAGGVATIPVPGTAWTGGANAVRAAFVGDDTHGARSSASVTVDVSKAASRLATSLPTSVRSSSRASLRIAVTVPNIPAPTGEIRVHDGGTRILTATLYAGNAGARTLTLPRLAEGRHSITVTYTGTAGIAAKTSGVRRISSS